MDIPTALFGDWLAPRVSPSGRCTTLGAGGQAEHRTAYALDERTVLKLASGDLTRSENRNEVKFYQAHPEFHAHLAPVFAWADDYSWLVMGRATEVGRHVADKLPAALRSHLRDMHAHNIGRYDGRIVCIDYGATAEHNPRGWR